MVIPACYNTVAWIKVTLQSKNLLQVVWSPSFHVHVPLLNASLIHVTVVVAKTTKKIIHNFIKSYFNRA